MTSLSRRSNVGTRGAPPLSSPFLPASSRGWSGCWCSAWINCQGRDICFLSQARYHNTKIPFVLGAVGHFGLAVRDPKKSARWFQRTLGLRKEFAFQNGVAVGNDNVTIALFKGKPSPSTLDHMSFHLPDRTTLRKAGRARRLTMVIGFNLARVRRSHWGRLYRDQPRLCRVLRPRRRIHCWNDAPLLLRGVLFQRANSRHCRLWPLVSANSLRPC